jgi:hypothetical protein
MILLLFTGEAIGVIIEIDSTIPVPTSVLMIFDHPLEWLVSAGGGWAVSDSGEWPVSVGTGWSASGGTEWAADPGEEWEVR